MRVCHQQKRGAGLSRYTHTEIFSLQVVASVRLVDLRVRGVPPCG
jgi:hypothetical protein